MPSNVLYLIVPSYLVTNFLAYLERHRLRIPDYQAFQTQGITIGSGAVESTIIELTH